MSETKKYARRTRRTRHARDNQKNNRGFQRDPRIISINDLIDNYDVSEGRRLAQLKVRWLPNRPSGADDQTDFDIEEQLSRFFVRRDQHNFKTDTGDRVVFDCPTSLPKSDYKDVNDNIVNEIRESSKTDQELAEALSMDAYLVNRIRHDGGCPICKWVSTQFNIDKKNNEARRLGASKKKHYYSWVIVESVNGKTDHEWCDGEPRLLFYKHTIFKALYQARYGIAFGTDGADDQDDIIDEDSVEAFYFYEVADTPGEGDEMFACEGRSFVINCIKGPDYPEYMNASKPSKFTGDATPLVNNEEEYWTLARKIQPLEDAMLRDKPFDTYEKIENYFNLKMGFTKARSNDDEDFDDEQESSRPTKSDDKPRRSRRRPPKEDVDDDDMFDDID